MDTRLAPYDRPPDELSARRIIEDIRFDRGADLEADKLVIANTPIEFQRKYIEKAESNRQVHANFTKTIASQIYSTKFRFIFEMIQNADDARYSGPSPTLVFRIRHSELIIESNELGFTRADVESICSTGKSSKKNETTTTGEKGFGFKSVFGIAREVHIQSGFWSFCFKYRKGEEKEEEDGIGMVTPIWTNPASEPLLKGFQTRFTLKYAEETPEFLERLIAEFQKLPDTTVFALRKLKKLKFKFELFGELENSGRRPSSIRFEKTGDFDQREILIETTTIKNGAQPESNIKNFRIFKTPITDLPREELRPTAESVVVIGLQIDVHGGKPVVPELGQQVLAFLPVERLRELPFLVQANFVLDASREKIIDNERNQKLRNGLADTFTTAVVSICRTDPVLTYYWMRYLPILPIEGFWKPLYSRIRDGLEKEKIFMSSRNNFRQPSHVRIVPDTFKHKGVPLFKDTEDDRYLAAQYEGHDIEALKNLLLEPLTEEEIVHRIEVDLKQNPESYLKGEYRDEAWHTSFITLLNGIKKCWGSLQQLSIIPLDEGGWVAPNSIRTPQVYFPYAIDEANVRIKIPSYLGLRRLHPSSCAETRRLNFYATIGVEYCSQDTIISKILEHHKMMKDSRSIRPYMRLKPEGTDADAISHLEILFWNCEKLQELRFSWRNHSLFLLSRDGLWRPASELFFPSKDPYHAEKLLEYSSPQDFDGFQFLNENYMKSFVQSSIRAGLTWTAFLEKLGVHYYPNLHQVNSRSILHPALRLVAMSNREKFVANLHAHWIETYRPQALVLRSTIKNITIPCRDGRLLPLYETILPTPLLWKRSDELGVQDGLPFIKLPDSASLHVDDSWRFLKDFDVMCDVSVRFYLAALGTLKLMDRTNILADGPNGRIKEIYSSIYEGLWRCMALETGNDIKNFFTASPHIYIPSSPPVWSTPNECVCDAPLPLRETHVLTRVYGSSDSHNGSCRLFSEYLQIGDAKPQHIFKDMYSLRKSNLESLPENIDGLMVRYYTALFKMMTSETIEIEQEIRDRFEKEELIYAKRRWSKISACVWNCPIEISGRTDIERLYPDLREFFVDKLGLSVTTPDFLAEELTKASALPSSTNEALKELMLALGQALGQAVSKDRGNEVDKENLKALKRNPFLVVCKAGNRNRCRATDDFFINDHERYGNAFKDKLSLLDFDSAELTSMHRLISILGLEGRYLSKHVRTDTVVNNKAKNDILTDHFRQRAYALSCCAIQFRSPQYFNQRSEAHERLLNTEVFICKDIYTNLIVRSAGTEHEVRSDRALFQIEKKASSLAVTVPSDEKELLACYHTELPQELAGILGIDTTDAEKSIYRILNDEHVSIATIMNDEDIPNYPWLFRPPSPALSTATTTVAVPEFDETQLVNDSSVSVVHSRWGSTARMSYGPSFSSPQPGFRSTNTLQRVTQGDRYSRFLDHVLRQARQQPSPAGTGSWSLEELNAALGDMTLQPDLREELGLSSGNPGSFEENARIGVAGELYVFERLLGLGLPGFGRDNWQSSLRTYAKVHPDYSDLVNFSQREIADIMYEEDSRQLDAWLRKMSEIPFPDLPSTGIVRYQLEVKSTLREFDTPFFMSQNQYKLMENNRLGPINPTTATTVYVIFRVYNLRGKIGLEVYVDPWRLQDNALVFEAGSWRVTPYDPEL